MDTKHATGKDWIDAELADSLDEDYELEFHEPALLDKLRETYRRSHPPTMPRDSYFLGMVGRQSELIHQIETGPASLPLELGDGD